jgi:purine-nucleoside phosphorylase
MDEEKVLIEPRKILGDPTIDHPIILVLFEPYFDFLRKELKVKKSSLKKTRFPSLTYFTTGKREKRISVFGTPLGAPQAALILERLIAMGAKKILTFGCCGSIQSNLSIGQMVIPSHAFSEEGTSFHYPLANGIAAKADETIVKICMEKCQEKNFLTTIGEVWTTDALFRETQAKVKKFGERGLLAVEMEMSALFTVAAYRNVQLGGLLVVSDELATLKWKTGFLNPFFWLNSKAAAKIVSEVCFYL